MPGFLYFIETDAKSLSPDLIHSAGLGYAIDSRVIQPVVAGPTGKPGFIVADAAAADRPAVRYRPTEQTWVRHNDADAHLGYYTDAPPTPSDLQRARMLPGRGVMLADDSHYQVPIVRRFAEFEDRLLWDCALPQSLSRNDQGAWVPRGPIARYARLWDMVQGYLAARETALSEAAAGETVFFQYEPINELAIGILGINYRVGPTELETLGLYTQEARAEILRIACDDDTRETWLKKKAGDLIRDIGDSSVGPAASTPADPTDTPPRSASCIVGPQESTASED